MASIGGALGENKLWMNFIQGKAHGMKFGEIWSDNLCWNLSMKTYDFESFKLKLSICV